MTTTPPRNHIPFGPVPCECDECNGKPTTPPPRDSRITREEMIAMFGKAMPIAAAKLLFETPDDWTIERVRDELRKLAPTPPREPAFTPAHRDAFRRAIAGRLLHGENFEGEAVLIVKGLDALDAQAARIAVLEATLKAVRDGHGCQPGYLSHSAIGLVDAALAPIA